MTELNLQVLGAFRVQDSAGAEIRIASRKGRALLAYLALRPGESHSRDRLATLLWEDADEELARTSLRQALAALRKSLPAETHKALLADTESVGIDPAIVRSDLHAFRRALDAGTRTSLQEAMSHYRGDLLDGFDARSTAFDEWLTSERLTLRKQLSDALNKLGELCVANGDGEGALAAATKLVALEPLNEAAHRMVMEQHAKRNAYAEALRQYRVCRDVLRRELDVAPEPATEQLYRDLMRRRRAALGPGEGDDAALDDTAIHEAPRIAEPAAALEVRPQLIDATILVARLEGLLELEAQLDPEESHALATQFHRRVTEAVTEFGGRTDRRVGSNVLAVFGIPTAYGNEPERAAQAALTLQSMIASTPWPVSGALALRIGIAQGQVLCGSAEIFPLTGRPTHVAHTLAARAADGEILISEELRASLGERTSGGRAASPQPGHAEPVAAWRLEGLRSEIGPGAQPFVGRRPELAMIIAALDRCTNSRHGRAIVVRGEAGIGKTSLVNAVRAAARERNVGVHSAQVFDFGQSPGRRPITALALSLLGLGADAPPNERAAAVRRALSGRNAVDQTIFLSDLIDAPIDAELAALEKAMEIATRQRGRALALAQLIESAVQRGPQLLVVEDVHWADTDELARFGEIAAVVVNCQILFIMTTRPEGDPINASWRARARGCPVTTVDLAPLAEDEAQELAAHFPELPQDMIHACIQRAEGHPLFLDQLLRAARAGHELLPGSVRSVVLARAARLSARDHAALQVAAVLGHRASLAALRRILGDDDYDPTALTETHLARFNGTELEFVHALFRDAIYESTLKSQRRELHRTAADWYASGDPALRADHLAAAEDERATAAYIDASLAEQAALRFERALGLVNKASALAREPLLLHRSSMLLGELLLQLGRTHDALTAYREALDFAIDQSGHGHAWIGVASALRIMDRHEEALEALEHAESALGDSADFGTRARMYTLRGNLCFPLGRLDACMQAHEQAHRFALEAQSHLEIARALSGLGDAYYQRGRIVTARERFARCVQEARDHDLVSVLLSNLPMMAVTHMYCGDAAASRESCREGLELARRVGDLRGELLVHLTLASGLLIQAQLDDSRRHARQVLQLAKQLGARRFEAESLGILAATLIAEDPAQALQLSKDALAIGRETGMSYCGPMLLSMVARLTSSPAERASALAEGGELLAAGCVSHSYFEFYSNAIEAGLQERDWASVRRYADKLEAYTSAEPLPWTNMLIKRARVLADAGSNGMSSATRASLEALRTECQRMETRTALMAVEKALSTT
ncbi:MAG TPA: BTAD domain-containing putative transcriptional regulator [Steroidobacteraceae bacterium]